MNALNPMAVLPAVLGDDALDVADVFSTDLYTGTEATQVITNGIDFSGQGGLAIAKRRDAASSHSWVDTERGIDTRLFSNSTNAATTSDASFASFNSDGITLGNNANVNVSSGSYVLWNFRKAAKFFDVVTYTGDGSTRRTLSHNLDVAPGLIITKKTSASGNWGVGHRYDFDQLLTLNATDAEISTAANPWEATVSDFTTAAGFNDNTANYVAYLFAHDTSDTGIIQCLSFTTDGSGNGNIDPGWLSQFVMLKASSTTGNWEMYDTARTPSFSGSDAQLSANLSNAETTAARLSFSGTQINFAGLSASQTYVVTVIRAEGA